MRVGSLEDLEEVLRASPRPVVLILDADNTIVPYGAPAESFAKLVADAVARFGALSSVSRVVVLTNGPPRGAVGIESRGNKPWTSRRRLGLGGELDSEVWVVGDQVLTDGVLAWRIADRFVHLVLQTTGEFSRQARMRRVGRLLSPVLFRWED